MAYFHLTQKGMEDAYQIINGLMPGCLEASLRGYAPLLIR